MSAAAPPARGPALAEDRATLPPEPRSASAARRLVRRLLVESGREEWLDAAELAVSEVVSNAILHAHTELEVSVRVLAEVVRVDVLDHSPLLPTQRSYDEMATTGRGLGLVAVLSTAFGIESREGNGKTVWFCVGDAPAAKADDILASWADLDEPGVPSAVAPVTGADGPGGGEQPVTAVLVGLPVRLWLAAQQHHDAVMREYVLASAERSAEAQDAADAPAEPGASNRRLPGPAAVQAADEAQGVLAAAVDRAVEAARAAGEPAHPLPEGHPSPLPEVPAALDVPVTVAADDVPAFAALQDVLDGAERLAVAGRLLARPALPEVVAVRDWVCEQVIAQAGGVGPSPWPGLEAALDEPPAVGGSRRPVPPPRWDTSAVRAADRPVVAADDSNRIIAVSEPLARLVGWPAEELVGRRVVALIPHRLRELHVAGFTRHLTTGEAYVLGVPLQLPVLRADGTEVVCEFLVERAPDTGSRAVYLAWMSEVSTA